MGDIHVYLYIVLVVNICHMPCVWGQDATSSNIAYVGETVTIVCPLTGNYTHPRWTGPPNNVLYTEGSFPDIYADRISYAADNRTLIRMGVTTADSGTYTCTTRIGVSIKEGHHILHVRVLPDPPEIQGSGIVLGTEGQPLVLTCVCRGSFPAPTLAWYRNTGTSAAVASTSGTDGDTSVTVTYTFMPVRNNDKDTYICQSSFTDSQPEPINQTSVQLYLNLKPSTPVVQQIGDVTAGSTATLQCDTSCFRPEATIAISWKYKGTVHSGSLHTVPDNDKYSATSTLQLPVQREDNGGSVECIVTHSTLSSPLSGFTSMDVHFAPYLVAVDGNKQTVANGATPLTLTCTVGAANPGVSGYSWTGPGVGTETSQIVRLWPTRDQDGDAVTCTATNYVGSTTRSTTSPPVILNMAYSPIATITGWPDTVIEGTPYVDLTCTASSKPPATFTWYKYTTILGTGTGTLAHNSWSYRINKVNRNDSGQYHCKASNGISPVDVQTMTLTIQYPPDVTATGNDGTVNDTSVTITCSANGVPNSYIYYRWIHTWSNGHVISHQPVLPATETLTLTNLTYQHSGIYTCSASNAVPNIIREGPSPFITIKSNPVIIDRVEKVSTQLHQPTNFNITYYSNAGVPTVSCHRVVNNVRLLASVGVVTIATAVIELPMLDNSTVPASGTRATVKLTIDNESELGFYQVKLHNTIGTTTVDLQIQSIGRPEPPEHPAVSGVSTTSVNVSWNLGFHGGLDQTCVVQYSTYGEAWIDGTTVYTGLSESRDLHHVSVESLSPGQLYYLRMYAYNEKGQSDYTNTFNVTTRIQVTDGESASSTAIGPIVGGLVAVLVVIVLVVGVTMLYKKGYRINIKRPGNKSDKYSANVYENDVGTDKRKPPNGT